MAFERLVVPLVILIAALAASGCGSSSSSPSTSHLTGPAFEPTNTTTTAAAPSAPHGKLTTAEYQTLIRVEKDGKKLGKIKQRASYVRRFRAVCAEVKKGPRTELVAAYDRFCRRVVRFLGALVAFQIQQKECQHANSVGDASCYGELLSRLARASNSVGASAREINAVVRRRGIKGKCAKGIGESTPEDLDEIEAIGHSARLASQALYAHTDLERLRSTVDATDAALKRLGSGPEEDTLAMVKTCPH